MNLIATTFTILLFFTCNNKAFNLYKSTIFRLYKRELLTTYTLLNSNATESVKNEFFDPKLPTRIYVHGYLGNEETIENYRQIFLKVGDYNFIAIDWTKGATTMNYYIAKARVPLVHKNFIRKKKLFLIII